MESGLSEGEGEVWFDREREGGLVGCLELLVPLLAYYLSSIPTSSVLHTFTAEFVKGSKPLKRHPKFSFCEVGSSLIRMSMERCDLTRA